MTLNGLAISGRTAMKVVTRYDPKPIPIRSFDWSAVDDDTYDGPPCPVGYGRTEAEAVADLLDQLEDVHQ